MLAIQSIRPSILTTVGLIQYGFLSTSPHRLNAICLFKQERLKINCAALFLGPFTRTYLQKETISQGSGMLHKPKILPEHVTCLFLRFGYKHNLWAWLGNACNRSYGQDRHRQEGAKGELKGKKAQSRTIHNKEDMKLRRKHCIMFSPLT